MSKVILAANTDWYLYNFRLSLAQYLRQQGFEVLVVSPPGRFVEPLRTAGLRWLPWHVGRQTITPWTEARAYLELEKIYRAEKPQFVHHFTVKPVLYGSIAARRLHIPAVINSITGLGYVFLNQDRKAIILRSFISTAYRAAFKHPNHAAIFENETDRQVFIKMGYLPIEDTTVIEGVGVDTERFMPQPEPEEMPLVVMPSRMLWDKGVGTLVEAARRLKPRIPVRIALIGEPDPGNPANIDESRLNAWVDERLVEWWGWQEDMPSVYARSSLVTLPSLGEGVPTALLEAAACGRAIVTTDVPGCREVVTHGVNGFLVPAQDPEALATAILMLLSDPALRSRMGMAGRQMVLEKFTSAQVNQAIYKVYQSLEQS